MSYVGKYESKLTMACSILLSIATALVPDALKGRKKKIQNQLCFVSRWISAAMKL